MTRETRHKQGLPQDCRACEQFVRDQGRRNWCARMTPKGKPYLFLLWGSVSQPMEPPSSCPKKKANREKSPVLQGVLAL